MKYIYAIIIIAAIVLGPTAYAAMKGLEFQDSAALGDLNVKRVYDYDKKVTCYVAFKSTTSSNVAMSCVK